MNPGDRIILVSIRPNYLEGIRGTVVRPQPGERRTLVRLDNDPKARRYAGGEWCLHNLQLKPDPTDDGIFALINNDIDARARDAIPAWTEDIAGVVEAAVDEWGNEHTHEIDYDRWQDLYRPALLWRFYTHLSNELRMIGQGHETVLFNSLREGNE